LAVVFAFALAVAFAFALAVACAFAVAFTFGPVQKLVMLERSEGPL
jgi:hypothetical protein